MLGFMSVWDSSSSFSMHQCAIESTSRGTFAPHLNPSSSFRPPWWDIAAVAPIEEPWTSTNRNNSSYVLLAQDRRGNRRAQCRCTPFARCVLRMLMLDMLVELDPASFSSSCRHGAMYSKARPKIKYYSQVLNATIKGGKSSRNPAVAKQQRGRYAHCQESISQVACCHVCRVPLSLVPAAKLPQQARIRKDSEAGEGVSCLRATGGKFTASERLLPLH
jgi:hypothetical protein